MTLITLGLMVQGGGLPASAKSNCLLGERQLCAGSWRWTSWTQALPQGAVPAGARARRGEGRDRSLAPREILSYARTVDWCKQWHCPSEAAVMSPVRAGRAFRGCGAPLCPDRVGGAQRLAGLVARRWGLATQLNCWFLHSFKVSVTTCAVAHRSPRVFGVCAPQNAVWPGRDHVSSEPRAPGPDLQAAAGWGQAGYPLGGRQKTEEPRQTPVFPPQRWLQVVQIHTLEKAWEAGCPPSSTAPPRPAHATSARGGCGGRGAVPGRGERGREASRRRALCKQPSRWLSAAG